MPPEPDNTHNDERATLDLARQHTVRLLEQLRRDADDLTRPSRLVAPDALAEGRVAFERAAAAAEALLRELDRDAPAHDQPTATDPTHPA